MAVLSSGYKRKSKGFRYVGPADSVSEVGDEPLQIKRKFPDVVVAVDTNRIAGIAQIRQEHPEVRLIVLDDAFQYRRLKPAYSVLLSDYYRPYSKDALLPFGKLRDLPAQARRADMIMVTKTPADVGPEMLTAQYQTLCPKPWQMLLFSHYCYGTPQPLFPNEAASGPPERAAQVVALTGIAHPQPFINEISKQFLLINHLRFSDHHSFTQCDVARINKSAVTYPKALIYTTEKDAMRLAEVSGFSTQAKSALFYIPIEVDFCSQGERQRFADILVKMCHQRDVV